MNLNLSKFNQTTVGLFLPDMVYSQLRHGYTSHTHSTVVPLPSYKGQRCLILWSTMLTCLLSIVIGFPPTKHHHISVHPALHLTLDWNGMVICEQTMVKMMWRQDFEAESVHDRTSW